MRRWSFRALASLAGVALAGGLVVGAVLADARAVLELLPGKPPAVYYFVRTDERKIALTIDDGPDRQTTPRLLDVLAKHGFKATFFVISGRILGNEALLRRIVDEGHELGNHMTEDVRSITLSEAEFERRFVAADRALSAFAPVRWFRPGSGVFNEHMLTVLARHDYRLALGSVYPLDSHFNAPNFAAWHIEKSTEPGSIIVLHDGGDRGEAALDALQRVLPQLAQAGFSGVTLSELAALHQPKVDAGQ